MLNLPVSRRCRDQTFEQIIASWKVTFVSAYPCPAFSRDRAGQMINGAVVGVSAGVYGDEGDAYALSILRRAALGKRIVNSTLW